MIHAGDDSGAMTSQGKSEAHHRWLTVDERFDHRFDVATGEARAIQQQLRGHIRLVDEGVAFRRAAGIDIGFIGPARARVGVMRAAAVVIDIQTLTVVEAASRLLPTRFPYVPGLLSFRELPAALAVLRDLSSAPDVLVCDGQGVAHPRRFGIACHLGLLTGMPAVGVAKSRLIGSFEEPPDERGAWTPLSDAGETIGAVLRTRVGVKPVFVSAGHRVSLAGALALTMSLTGRYRLPETTRAAHRLASQPG